MVRDRKVLIMNLYRPKHMEYKFTGVDLKMSCVYRQLQMTDWFLGLHASVLGGGGVIGCRLADSILHGAEESVNI